MKFRNEGRASLAALTIAAALATPAMAQDATQQQLMDRISHQDKEIEALKKQVEQLTKMMSGGAVQAAPSGKKTAASKITPEAAAATEARLNALEEKVDEQGKVLSTRVGQVEQKTQDGKVVMTNATPRWESSNGNFTASLRALVQYDFGYYMQDNVPGTGTAQDLNSGSNFRRARFGVEGTLYKVWSYNFTGEWGGSGSEQPVQIQQAYIQYNGWKPFAFRVGAFSPYVSLEDSTPVGELLFMERADATEITRGIAGSDGRYGVSVVAQGDRYLASVAYTGSKVNGSNAATAQTFDEQQGVVGRFAALAYSSKTANLVLGANGSYVFDTADTVAGPAGLGNFTFSNAPEIRVDDTGTNNAPTSLISTGAIPGRQVWHWGADGAAQWKSLYAEGGYFKFGATRNGEGTPASTNPEFGAWYAQASWVITGEPHRYNAPTGSFRAPKVAHPVTLGSNGGWGAWEIAGRYSATDLNFNAGLAGRATPAGGIRGGEQDIWTLGLNWYPNDAIRFSANYLRINVDRLSAAGAHIGQKVQALGIRSQLAF